MIGAATKRWILQWLHHRTVLFLQAFHSQEKQYYADYAKKYLIFY
jgi:hypothetical protein